MFQIFIATINTNNGPLDGACLSSCVASFHTREEAELAYTKLQQSVIQLDLVSLYN